MTKDELLKEAIDVEQSLQIMEEKETDNLSSIEFYYLKWKTNDISKKLDKIELNLSSLKKNKLKISKGNIFFSCLLFLIMIFSAFIELYSIFVITLILLLLFINQAYLASQSRTEDLIDDYFIDYLTKLNKEIIKNSKKLENIKISIPKKEKNLTEKFISDMFDQANIDISKMIDTKNANLNYKDRDYRNFLIELYNLKISEKELNNFYRQILRIILEEDLKTSPSK